MPCPPLYMAGTGLQDAPQDVPALVGKLLAQHRPVSLAGGVIAFERLS